MSIEIRPVTSRAERRQFVYLPERIHRGHQRWVPPLYADEANVLDARKNRALTYSDLVMALAYKQGAPVGRVAGIINNRYNELRGERTARFSHFESIDDPDVVAALLGFVEKWARDKGMTKVIGPMGFTDQDPEGFLVDGFEHEPALASQFNFEFVPRLVEKAGYSKEVDYVVYTIPVPDEIPDFYRKMLARAERQGIFTLLEFSHRRELKQYIYPALQLMNETYRDLHGYSPLDEAEMLDLARRYLPVIDPRFVKMVTEGGHIVGFIVGMPDLNDGLRKARGRLLPLGWLWILRAARRARRLDLLLGGIKEEHRGRGVDVLLGAAMMRSARSAGFTHMDSHHELESNTRIRAEMERAGGTVYKRYRIYQKTL